MIRDRWLTKVYICSNFNCFFFYNINIYSTSVKALFSLLLIFTIQQPVRAQVTEADSLALVALYNAANCKINCTKN